MSNLSAYLNSGILDAYIEGRIPIDQAGEVEKMATLHQRVRNRLDELSRAFEARLLEQSIAPPAYIKPLVMASINYMERISRGETLSDPPVLHGKSVAKDYEQWLKREDFQSPQVVEGMFIRIIRKSREMTTAVVWMEEMCAEVHANEIEQFLIVEGACTVFIGPDTHYLKAGDNMKIPAGKAHHAVSTGLATCKIILQRLAVAG